MDGWTDFQPSNHGKLSMSATTARPPPGSSAQHDRLTVTIYDHLRRAGVLDYTEGFYQDDPRFSYDHPQNQIVICWIKSVPAWLAGLEIGCGNARCWRRWRPAGRCGAGGDDFAAAFQYCRERRADRHLLTIGTSFGLAGRFDAVGRERFVEQFRPTGVMHGRPCGCDPTAVLRDRSPLSRSAFPRLRTD